MDKWGSHSRHFNCESGAAVSCGKCAIRTTCSCRAPDCAVVYYRRARAQTFHVDELRKAAVHQKRPDDDDVLVRYCFRHSIGEIAGPRRSGAPAILADINAGIRAGQCACDLRNPEGTCCLGNVRALMASLSASRRVISQADDALEPKANNRLLGYPVDGVS